MKPAERRSRIAEAVAAAGQMSVEALADLFEVSAETIRRDLAQLDEAGRLQKMHGGARRPRLHIEGPLPERMEEDTAGKEEIGRKLAAHVRPGETIFVDTGSTTVIGARALAEVPGLTVITNSLGVAQVLGQAGGTVKVFLLGGAYGAGNAQTVGPMVIDQIDRFQADQAVITVAAVDAETGAMDSDAQEAHVARAMMARSERVVVLANGAKIGRRAAFRLCRLDAIDTLITNVTPDEAFMAALARAKVELL
ncbi:DeoR/GlpR family DNA-binding transcription regulator [Maritimibacter alkaliphilus]|uniref:DeoR/GlpR family DNA-binding transcription regulator n=1 Tax=Maritimibacter alkaliphilus TaxID=404236 RepID=UPI001C946D0A|nr:DeoR/GlpR family DNA-binding transcription regulator [Maritimibacter alkaliphilus]MBY6091712.1 DeoR/GlpR family DNA-binding transcription regulator [Maritimibacter alkaliphilus]